MAPLVCAVLRPKNDRYSVDAKGLIAWAICWSTGAVLVVAVGDGLGGGCWAPVPIYSFKAKLPRPNAPSRDVIFATKLDRSAFAMIREPFFRRSSAVAVKRPSASGRPGASRNAAHVAASKALLSLLIAVLQPRENSSPLRTRIVHGRPDHMSSQKARRWR
jgi:hypothetical protein